MFLNQDFRIKLTAKFDAKSPHCPKVTNCKHLPFNFVQTVAIDCKSFFSFDLFCIDLFFHTFQLVCSYVFPS